MGSVCGSRGGRTPRHGLIEMRSSSTAASRTCDSTTSACRTRLALRPRAVRAATHSRISIFCSRSSRRLPSTGLMQERNSDSYSAWVFGVRRPRCAAMYRSAHRFRSGTSTSDVRHTPRSWSASTVVRYRWASVLVANGCGAACSSPVRSGYRACHLPDGSRRTLPNRRRVTPAVRCEAVDPVRVDRRGDAAGRRGRGSGPGSCRCHRGA